MPIPGDAMRFAVVKSSQSDLRLPGHPVAVWEAFARQAAWKSWVIVILLGLLGLSLLVNVRLATRPPEFVVVENPSGQATLVRQSVATDALLRFLDEQTRPPDVTVVRFTRDFLQLAFAVNSSTVHAAWPAALTMMTPALRDRVSREAAGSRLVETYQAAQVRTDLAVVDLALLARTASVVQARATLARRKAPLVGGGVPVEDRLVVELVLEMVPASPEHPDGLAVSEWQVRDVPAAQAVAGG
jgi:hypothetical protein